MHTPLKTPLVAVPSIATSALDPRSTAVLRELVEVYVATGEPVGSRTLSRRLPLNPWRRCPRAAADSARQPVRTSL